MQNIIVGYVQVKLGKPGWRERYYEEKFGARTPEQIEEICRDVVSFSRQYFFLQYLCCLWYNPTLLGG